jgi:hypothetical protein
MPSSILLDLPGPVALACHDAGAANHIFSWMEADAAILAEAVSHWRLLAEGPAAKLWTDYGLPGVCLCQGIDELLEGAQTLVSGTGWASSLEYSAIRKAHQHGIYSIAVIDHWVNYRTRFQRDGIEILPDEIWVSDSDARDIAGSEFDGIKITLKQNYYLENIVHTVRMHECANDKRKNILYVLEPIRGAWGDQEVNGEFEALDYFIRNISALGLGESPTIRLRPHPSDPAGKYDQWISEQKGQDITLDNCPTLAESLALSDTVVGCQTYAMVVALAAGRKVFSSIPPWAPPCVLPQKDIIRISDVSASK